MPDDGARVTAAHPDWTPQAVDAVLANLQHHPDGTVQPWLAADRHRGIVASMLANRPRGLYPQVRCPVTLLAASSGNPLVAEARAALPRARLDEYPGADHDLHAQHPDRVAAAIAALG